MTRIRPTAATAVISPNVMAMPLLSAIEPTIMPPMPRTNTTSTSRTTASRMADAATQVDRRPSPRTQRLVLDAVGLVGVGAQLLVAERLVLAEVALEPAHLRVALEGEHVGGDAVEEPAIVADDHGAAGERLEAVLEGPQRVDVEVVGRLVEQQHVAARP